MEAELDATVTWRHEGEIAIEPTDEKPAHRHLREMQGYTRYLSGWNSHAMLRFANDRTLTLKTEGTPLNHVVVHCPAGADYLCVEPVSHVSDGFNLDAKGIPGTGIAFMPPGSEITASLSMESDATPGPTRRRRRALTRACTANRLREDFAGNTPASDEANFLVHGGVSFGKIR